MSSDKFQIELTKASQAMAAKDFFTARHLAESMIKNGGKSDVRVQSLYARALQGTGDLEGALKVQRKLIKKLPGEPTLRFAHAQMLVQRGRADQAFTELKAAEALGSKHPGLLSAVAGAYHALGAAYGGTRHYSDALAAFMSLAPRAAELTPEDAALRLRYGEVLMVNHRHDEALAHLEAAAAHPHMRERGLLLLMRFYLEIGTPAKTLEIGRELISGPNPVPGAFLLMSRADPTVFSDEEIATMESLMRGDVEHRRDVGFALGHFYDHKGEFDTAFGWYAEANKARKSQERSKLSEILAAFENVIELFPGETLQGADTSGIPTGRPIFVVGMPRSGTSLLERILGCHPKVTAAGELADIGRVCLATGGRVPDADQAADMRDAYEEALAFHCPGAERVVDKMPRNFINVGFIHRMYPDAIILHCSRDPMATCFSNYVTDFDATVGGESELTELGKLYRGYERLMAHWKQVIPESRLIDVCYEDLVKDPEPQIRRVLAACGLEWDEACLAFHHSTEPAQTASVSQVRKPLYSSSVDRWRRYEAHLGPLADALNA